MSRFGASLGGSLGFVAGAAAGALASSKLRGARYDVDPSSDNAEFMLGGALVGAIVGAALGAGPSTVTVKEVGTAGAPHLESVGGFP